MVDGVEMAEPATEPMVKHFRLALLWPLRLLPVAGSSGAQQRPWQILRDMGEACPWRELEHDAELEGSVFQERHYTEFVTFLPYVQQFLRGEPDGPIAFNYPVTPAFEAWLRNRTTRS